jgi:hypothetical protein
MLRRYPELLFSPTLIAERLQRENPDLRFTGRNVSKALSKIRKKHDGRIDIQDICECLGRIVIVEESERVCQSCGRSYGQIAVNLPNTHSEFINSAWLVYQSNERPLGISHEASRIQAFGKGLKATFTWRIHKDLLDIFKSHPELDHSVTDAITRLVTQNCNARSLVIKRETKMDCKDCIILALLEFGKRMPSFKNKMDQIIHETCQFFYDSGTRAPKSPKSPKFSNLDAREFD